MSAENNRRGYLLFYVALYLSHFYILVPFTFVSTSLRLESENKALTEEVER